MTKERLASFISGGGTTMEQMIIACQSNKVQMNVGCVIASNESAGGILKARKLNVPVVVINPENYRGDDKKIDQEGFGTAILTTLHKYGATVVTQNGWMPLTPEIVIDKYEDAIFNQHPGPVPEFGGMGMHGKRVHTAVLIFRRETKGEMWTMAIAQRVAKDFDQGAVVKSIQVNIKPIDEVDDLQQRVLPMEHSVQIALLKDIASGNVKERPVIHIVKPGEENVLYEAKKAAKALYPHNK